MRKVRFGFVIPAELSKPEQRPSWVKNIHAALRLVSGHFDSAWMVDHLMFEETAVLESMTGLSYLMGQYPELNFGHAVLCQSFRKPALLAKMAATLQFMSEGRFILGMGAGWHEDEYRAYGYDFPSAAVRVEELEEALQIIKLLWTEKTANFAGKHYQIHNAFLEPKPNPIPPIMLGAFKPKMLRLTAKLADCWNVSSTSIKQYRLMNAEFEKACAEIGRDSSAIKRSWIGGCVCAETQAEAERLVEGRWGLNDEDDFGFLGSPKQILEQLQPFIEEGVTEFIMDCGGFPNLTTLEMLINEVLPELS
jgi:alkanesulfonate monooxygenase SsuD/methylene tetrahydromethanopterin reductase-like flavin-dependent oxidoreductase (luciferase family)